MLPNESRRVWSGVTTAINAKEYNKATDLKVAVEEQKRKEAVERQEKNITWKPQYFDVTNPGIPTLTPEGQKMLDMMSKGLTQ